MCFTVDFIERGELTTSWSRGLLSPARRRDLLSTGHGRKDGVRLLKVTGSVPWWLRTASGGTLLRDKGGNDLHSEQGVVCAVESKR